MQFITIEKKVLKKLVDEDILEMIISKASIKNIEVGQDMLFSRLYLAWRRKQKHVGFNLVVPGSAQWHWISKLTLFIKDEVQAEYGEDFKTSVKRFFELSEYLHIFKLNEMFKLKNKILEYIGYSNKVHGKYYTKVNELVNLYYEMGFVRFGKLNFMLRDYKNKAYFVDLVPLLKKHKIEPSMFFTQYFEYWGFIGGWVKPNLLAHLDTLNLLKEIKDVYNTGSSSVKGSLISLKKKL